MPPGTGDVALSLSQTVPVAGAIVVTTPQQVSLADTPARGARCIKKLNIPTLGIIENMSHFVCPTAATRADIFGHGGGEQLAHRAAACRSSAAFRSTSRFARAATPACRSSSASRESPAARAFIAAAERTAAQVSIASYTQAARFR